MKDKIFIVPLNDAEGYGISKMLRNEGYTKGVDLLETHQDWGASWDKLEPSIKLRLNDYFPTKKITVEANMHSEGLFDINDKVAGKQEFTVEIPHFPDYKRIDDTLFDYRTDNMKGELNKKIFNALVTNDVWGSRNEVGKEYSPRLILGVINAENGVATAGIVQIDNYVIKSIEDIPAKVDKAEKPVYGIELKGNIGLENIDHHTYENEDRYNSKSSIEQVAEILNHEMSIGERAIAVNDKEGINGMIDAGFPKELIDDVRDLDRSAQHITPKMEAEAEKAINEMTHENGVAIVELDHNKCASVTDRLYDTEHNILIVSRNSRGYATEVNFYGDADYCKAVFSLMDDFGGRSRWQGGNLKNDNGYAGIELKGNLYPIDIEEKIIDKFEAVERQAEFEDKFYNTFEFFKCDFNATGEKDVSVYHSPSDGKIYIFEKQENETNWKKISREDFFDLEPEFAKKIEDKIEEDYDGNYDAFE